MFSERTILALLLYYSSYILNTFLVNTEYFNVRYYVEIFPYCIENLSDNYENVVSREIYSGRFLNADTRLSQSIVLDP